MANVKKVSKRSVIIGLMIANKTKPMAEVVALIKASKDFVHHSDVDGEARYYYAKFVRTNVAPGTLVRKAKVAKTKAKAKAKVAKTVKSTVVQPLVDAENHVEAVAELGSDYVTLPKPIPAQDDLTVPNFLRR